MGDDVQPWCFGSGELVCLGHRGTGGLAMTDDGICGANQALVDGHLAGASPALVAAEVVDRPDDTDAERSQHAQLGQEAGIREPGAPAFAAAEVAMRPVEMDDRRTSGTQPCGGDGQQRDAPRTRRQAHLNVLGMQGLGEQVLVGVGVGRQEGHAEG